MGDGPDATAVAPAGLLEAGGWERLDERRERLASLPTAVVRGHTLVYEDRRLRAAVREATGLDRVWRFFFLTRLAFDPPPLPGTEPMALLPVASRARDAFEADLRERGFREVQRGRTETTRIGGGRARLTRFRAHLPLDGDPLQVGGVLAVWVADGFRVAGGAYPEDIGDLVDLPDVDADPVRYREELLELVRAVD